MRASSLSICALATVAHSTSLLPRVDTCRTGYKVCAPSGATTTTVPKIGDASFRQLYLDLIATNLPDGNSKRRRELDILGGSSDKRESASLCCEMSTLCYSMASISVPFCYDKFTTNYFLPDGAFGTLINGSYSSATGDSANLLSGDYTLSSGAKGNIYTGDESQKPNTATLSIPAQFTGTGVGGAIPASVLGGFQTVVYTEVVSATTIPESTITGSVVTRTLSNGVSATGTSSGGAVFATSVVVSTLPASTVQGTTRTAVQTVVTTATVGASEASVLLSSAAAATSSQGLAAEGRRMGWGGLGAGLAIGAAIVL